ncbi:hypothetical protein ACOME3_008971 [Neoechinorhynchus agilis]
MIQTQSKVARISGSVKFTCLKLYMSFILLLFVLHVTPDLYLRISYMRMKNGLMKLVGDEPVNYSYLFAIGTRPKIQLEIMRNTSDFDFDGDRTYAKLLVNAFKRVVSNELDPVVIYNTRFSFASNFPDESLIDPESIAIFLRLAKTEESGIYYDKNKPVALISASDEKMVDILFANAIKTIILQEKSISYYNRRLVNQCLWTLKAIVDGEDSTRFFYSVMSTQIKFSGENKRPCVDGGRYEPSKIC